MTPPLTTMTWVMIASGAVAVLGSASLIWWALGSTDRELEGEGSAWEAGRQWAMDMIDGGMTIEEIRASILCCTFNIGDFEEGALDYLRRIDHA